MTEIIDLAQLLDAAVVTPKRAPIRMTSRHNLALLTDSYKVSHWRQYPPGTAFVYSYFESRGGRFAQTVFAGLQYQLLEYLTTRVTEEDVEYAAERWAKHFGTSELFNAEGWMHIVRAHEGRLPLVIKAVQEGTSVPTSNVLMTVENTDPKVPWLTNWCETLLSQCWYPTTVATLSREMKRIILNSLKRTGSPELIDFKLHDFGFRGVSSVESAAIGGFAHLINFRGTDTAAAFELANEYYGADMAGFSIPAAEHSTITSWGRDRELDAYRNMVEQFGQGMYAVVSDSYDIFAACRAWGSVLKDAVLAAPGTLVVRPDSGVPHQVVPDVLAALSVGFGYTTNDKGFKVLNKVRVIQGDGIDYDETERILAHCEIAGWSTDNVAFGMGGALLQKLNRDTQKFAFKCSHIYGVDRNVPQGARLKEWERDVYKEPATDPGKNSKRGRLKLLRVPFVQLGYTDGAREGVLWRTVPAQAEGIDELVEVFRDGEVLQRYTLDDLRKRAAL